MKIKCLTISTTGRWPALSGKDYIFFAGKFTEINTPEDQVFFLKAGGGKSFVTDEKVDIKKLEASIKQKEEAKEESIRGRNRIVQEAEPVKKIVTKIEPEPKEEDINAEEPKTNESEEKIKHTYKELEDKNKPEQVEMIKKLSPDTGIPKLEHDRIELIIKLESE